VVVGAPLLYLRGALIDKLVNGADLPGACADVGEMRSKAKRLVNGDKALSEGIRSTQDCVLDAFTPDLARRQWATALSAATLR
jgi:hypothetical protein